MKVLQVGLLLTTAIVALAVCSPASGPTITPTPPTTQRTFAAGPGPVAILPPEAPPPLVLSSPTADSAPISSQPEFGEAAPIVGRDPTGDWWQVEVHGEVGWLPASAIEVLGDVSAVPIVSMP